MTRAPAGQQGQHDPDHGRGPGQPPEGQSRSTAAASSPRTPTPTRTDAVPTVGTPPDIIIVRAEHGRRPGLQHDQGPLREPGPAEHGHGPHDASSDRPWSSRTTRCSSPTTPAPRSTSWRRAGSK
ncbi:MAG: hypothetical protein M0C28_30190 [Candidatus Moduliflexus flocculans]|nr:hypothetical protein [Candidatus Moduliflexus flocculans]